MAQYTIEDIEILRQKSGISYEEAVNLLEYHNGSLARALIDLEKNGRLKDSKPGQAYGRSSTHAHGFFNSLYRFRIRISKGETTVVNLSALFIIFSLLVAVPVVVIGALAALLLGYRFTVERNSRDFSKDSLESMVKNAGSNVRNSVASMARDFSAKSQSEQPTTSAEPEKRSESPASGTTPVNVAFSDEGSVRVTETRDGYHEADIQ